MGEAFGAPDAVTAKVEHLGCLRIDFGGCGGFAPGLDAGWLAVSFGGGGGFAAGLDTIWVAVDTLATWFAACPIDGAAGAFALAAVGVACFAGSWLLPSFAGSACALAWLSGAGHFGECVGLGTGRWSRRKH